MAKFGLSENSPGSPGDAASEPNRLSGEDRQNMRKCANSSTIRKILGSEELLLGNQGRADRDSRQVQDHAAQGTLWTFRARDRRPHSRRRRCSQHEQPGLSSACRQCLGSAPRGQESPGWPRARRIRGEPVCDEYPHDLVLHEHELGYSLRGYEIRGAEACQRPP